jgi:hypothetical protein
MTLRVYRKQEQFRLARSADHALRGVDPTLQPDEMFVIAENSGIKYRIYWRTIAGTLMAIS